MCRAWMVIILIAFDGLTAIDDGNDVFNLYATDVVLDGDAHGPYGYDDDRCGGVKCGVDDDDDGW